MPESSSSIPDSAGIIGNYFLSNLSVSVPNTKTLTITSLWWNKEGGRKAKNFILLQNYIALTCFLSFLRYYF